MVEPGGMLTISKNTIFNPDGMAVRGQCSHDSPGWQLRWFDRNTLPVTIWQGAFKTCRRLQASCHSAASLEEAKAMAGGFLNTDSFSNYASRPTDAYPAADGEEGESGGEYEWSDALSRKKRKKKKR